ncbi:MAG: ABC transporter ATP-binding protein, partial [Pseudoflavonifractor sp.]
MSEEKKVTAHGPARGPMGGHGPAGRMMPGEKAKNFRGTIGKLLAYMGKYKIALVFIALFAVGSTAFSVIGPKIMGSATSEIAAGLMAKLQGKGGIDFIRIGEILIFLLCLYLGSALLSFVQGWLMSGISQKMAYRMRREISEKIH